METQAATVYRRYIGIMEKKMEAIIVYLDLLGSWKRKRKLL